MRQSWRIANFGALQTPPFSWQRIAPAPATIPAIAADLYAIAASVEGIKETSK
jgi:hypothetical protein